MNHLLAGVRDYLIKSCNFEKINKVEALVAENCRRLLHAPRIRLASHFDPDIDFFVFDGVLGTLGLVRLFKQDADNSRESVRKSLDQATYIRHILVSNCLEDAFPLTVELVLMADEAGLERPMGEVLRELVRESNYLHAIGVNILIPTGTDEKGFRTMDLRRAFSWLLPETEKWFAGNPPDGRDDPASAPASLSKIELNNYRLPGKREIHLSSDTGIHLLHGHNGSGKSSLAEALELILTGKVRRLPEGLDYTEALVNHACGKDVNASIKLTKSDKSDQDFVVTPDGVDTPLAGKLQVASFRLDQPLMDSLSRMGPGERASVFLSAYFPAESRAKLTDFEKYKKVAKESFVELPQDIKKELTKDNQGDIASRMPAMKKRLGWLEDRTPLNLEALDDCLPLFMNELQVLLAVRPEFDVFEKWKKKLSSGEELHADLERLDRGLQAVIDEQTLARDLARARDILVEHSDWVATGKSRKEDYAEVLNSWMEHIALVDLLKKRLELETTLQEAKKFGWWLDPKAGFTTSIFGNTSDPRTIDELKSALAKLSGKKKQLYQTLKSFEIVDVSSARAETDNRFKRLTPADIHLLNKVGEWICPRTGVGKEAVPLGEALNTALNQQIPMRSGKFEIGKKTGWGKPLVKRLEEIQTVHIKLIAHEVGGKFAVYRFEKLRESLMAHQKFEKQGKELQGTLFWYMMQGDATDGDGLADAGTGRATSKNKMNRDKKAKKSTNGTKGGTDVGTTSVGIGDEMTGDATRADYGKLLRAVNELMALFTPARWAYQDIALPLSTSPDGQHQLGFTWGEEKKDAEFLLNTAELNLFTIAIFLLFAPLQQNPLRLLIFDDPLQNMDELTVSCVAKGLAKLDRLWRKNPTFAWQLMILFHGEEDLERFRQEVPAALYRLPWLSPGEHPDCGLPSGETTNNVCKIINECPSKTLKGELQNLTELFTQRP